MLATVTLGSGCLSGRQRILPPAMQGLEVPEQYAPIMTAMQAGGEREWVMHLNFLAVEAMRNGDRDLAERALDESILNINNVFGTTDAARKARTIFFNEDVKLFKGDAYERCMAFFYRGVLYMQRGDWSNARASFRSGVLQDAFAEEEQFRADWSLLDYLIGVCEVQMGQGDYAAEAFARARESRGGFAESYKTVVGGDFPHGPDPFAINGTNNLLVLVQDGRGPIKTRTGEHGQWLAYRAAPGPRPSPRVSACGLPATTPALMESLHYQATTRGGRPFDRVQRRKVVFKDATRTTGEVAGLLGYALLTTSGGGDESQAIAGVALLGAGLAFYAVSALTAVRADVRMWGNLPEALAVYAPEGCQGQVPLTVYFTQGAPTTSVVDVPEPGKGLAVVLALPGQQSALLGPVTQ